MREVRRGVECPLGLLEVPGVSLVRGRRSRPLRRLIRSFLARDEIELAVAFPFDVASQKGKERES